MAIEILIFRRWQNQARVKEKIYGNNLKETLQYLKQRTLHQRDLQTVEQVDLEQNPGKT
jgi:hypothetical protein